MSLQDFHALFSKEIDRYLAKLATRGKTSPGQREDQPYVHELKRLARQMAESVLQRLAANATKWGLDQQALDGKLGTEGNAQSKASSKSARLDKLRSRCQDLEAEVRRHQQEEEKRKSEVLGRFKAQYDAILQSQEQELLQIRRAVATSEDGAPHNGTLLRQELSEQLKHIQTQLASTKAHVIELDSLKQNLDKIEDQQRRAIPPMEALLASTMDNWPDDTEDEILAANIRKGEQVCKRLRQHQSY
ncbi:unnamed protein product [Symbiodinium natans]|uniref:Uncharacterized protein n=1 Tax=Symbiodinium natans TaxID=878477 RepID=A0A812QLU0_9DINO|nr:unnamed protein product [Symbiodinium natans]